MTAASRWFRSLRAYSFPASLVPVLIAAALASQDTPSQVAWRLVLPFALATLLFHAGTNVLNDYFDYRHGVDRPGDSDPSHVITQGVVGARFMLVSGHLYFAGGVALGAIMALERGLSFFLSGLAGALGAYYYTNARFSLKYRALGDVAVFLLMGPALVFMGIWALTGHPSGYSIIAALPLGFLVTAMLHGNNMRDINVDATAGVDTLARRIGVQGSKVFFVALFGTGYGSVVLAVLSEAVPPTVLVSVPALAAAWPILKRVTQARNVEELVDLPQRCAGHYLLFGLLYGTGLFISAVLA